MVGKVNKSNLIFLKVSKIGETPVKSNWNKKWLNTHFANDPTDQHCVYPLWATLSQYRWQSGWNRQILWKTQLKVIWIPKYSFIH
jgi:hypothetical protein